VVTGKEELMLSESQCKAIRLMFDKPDEDVAAEIEVSPDTISEWKQDPEFRQALSLAERAIKSTTARLASAAVLIAAMNLKAALRDNKDNKLALDTLKSSGAFELKLEDETQTLADVLREIAEKNG